MLPSGGVSTSVEAASSGSCGGVLVFDDGANLPLENRGLGFRVGVDAGVEDLCLLADDVRLAGGAVDGRFLSFAMVVECAVRRGFDLFKMSSNAVLYRPQYQGEAWNAAGVGKDSGTYRCLQA